MKPGWDSDDAFLIRHKAFPKTGTGRAMSATVSRRIWVPLLRAMNPPLGRGVSAACHVAIQDAAKSIDINFTEHGARELASRRLAEVQGVLDLGVSLDKVNLARSKLGCVPLGTDLLAAATFEVASDPTLATIPIAAREWYTEALKSIIDSDLAVAIHLFETTTHAGCIPLAILKERLGLGTAIVGKLGFRDPKTGLVTDWEYGADGIAWF